MYEEEYKCLPSSLRNMEQYTSIPLICFIYPSKGNREKKQNIITSQNVDLLTDYYYFPSGIPIADKKVILCTKPMNDGFIQTVDSAFYYWSGVIDKKTCETVDFHIAERQLSFNPVGGTSSSR